MAKRHNDRISYKINNGKEETYMGCELQYGQLYKCVETPSYSSWAVNVGDICVLVEDKDFAKQIANITGGFVFGPGIPEFLYVKVSSVTLESMYVRQEVPQQGRSSERS